MHLVAANRHVAKGEGVQVVELRACRWKTPKASPNSFLASALDLSGRDCEVKKIQMIDREPRTAKLPSESSISEFAILRLDTP